MSKKEIGRLEREIRAYRDSYERGEATISDKEYDKLIDELHSLDPTSAALSEVGKAHSRSKVAHASPMLSLEKTKLVEDVLDWALETNEDRFVIMPKYDGVSLSVVYSRKLVRAVTRGDGVEGDDVTHIARNFLPPQCGAGECEVRGEVVFRRSTWEAVQSVFAERAGAGRTVNARNAAAGSLLRKVLTPEARQLEFVPYDVRRIGAASLRDELCDTVPTELGLRSQDVWFCDLSDLQRTIDLALKTVTSADFPFDTDGLVVRVDSYNARASIGATAHHPKWALALKHNDEEKQTRLIDVQWQVSRTGKITPVAIVEPVQLSGVTVSRCTLHHAGNVRALKLRKNDRVLMSRRGGVIPHIERVLPNLQRARTGSTELLIPTKCPCCKSPVRWAGDFLLCANAGECPDAQRGKLLYWCQQTDMMGFGEEVIGALYDDGLVMQPCELYTTPVSDFQELFGMQRGKNLASEAKKHSKLTPEQLINALGFEGIGKTQAGRIFEKMTFDEMMHHYMNDDYAWIVDKLPGGFGPALRSSLFAGLSENLGIIQSLADVVEIVSAPKASAASGPFAGRKIVFTGQLADISREAAQEQVRMLGGQTPSSVTKDTTYLVVGSRANPDALSKRQKALHYNAKGANISIIEEETYLELLANALAAQEKA